MYSPTHTLNSSKARRWCWKMHSRERPLAIWFHLEAPFDQTLKNAMLCNDQFFDVCNWRCVVVFENWRFTVGALNLIMTLQANKLWFIAPLQRMRFTFLLANHKLIRLGFDSTEGEKMLTLKLAPSTNYSCDFNRTRHSSMSRFERWSWFDWSASRLSECENLSKRYIYIYQTLVKLVTLTAFPLIIQWELKNSAEKFHIQCWIMLLQPALRIKKFKNIFLMGSDIVWKKFSLKNSYTHYAYTCLSVWGLNRSKDEEKYQHYRQSKAETTKVKII